MGITAVQPTKRVNRTGMAAWKASGSWVKTLVLFSLSSQWRDYPSKKKTTVGGGDDGYRLYVILVRYQRLAG